MLKLTAPVLRNAATSRARLQTGRFCALSPPENNALAHLRVRRRPLSGASRPFRGPTLKVSKGVGLTHSARPSTVAAICATATPVSVRNRREADIADRGRVRRTWADCGPTGVPSGRTGVWGKPAFRSDHEIAFTARSGICLLAGEASASDGSVVGDTHILDERRQHGAGLSARRAGARDAYPRPLFWRPVGRSWGL
jgi:hypothetical protein